jgi:hypothetical protein
MRWRWLLILPVLGLLVSGCDKHRAKKPDPTKGTVTGVVICADTGKPARFATVTLSAAPRKVDKAEASDPLPAAETTTTDLEGRFRLEAVEPGRYYAFATLEGYLDPALGLDMTKLVALSSDRERHQSSIDQWKDHLTEVTVHVHRVSDLPLQIERAAEISGTVSFDDGSPAIGMHFQILRKTDKGGWTDVGLPLLDTWSIHAVSDGHGRFSLTNLTAGEYTVCALLPADSQDSAPRICLGGVFRRKGAKTVKVEAGESASGTNIEIPLSGLHTVAGTVSVLADGHAPSSAILRLLYADDREKARETKLEDDGSFSFEYVPEGKYILAVSGAQDAGNKVTEADPGGGDSAAGKTVTGRHYADKEIPVTVMDNMDDVQVQLAPAAPEKPNAP